MSLDKQISPDKTLLGEYDIWPIFPAIYKLVLWGGEIDQTLYRLKRQLYAQT